MTLEADSVNVQALDMGHIVVDIDGVNRGGGSLN
ncbi:hypothetical protein HUSEC_26571 [Escherichia coli O104:H4 str. LB226692]|nr:hypothetical protein HUSEC_26571 [Escherichia coli O104:H4 str. LB226692]